MRDRDADVPVPFAAHHHYNLGFGVALGSSQNAACIVDRKQLAVEIDDRANANVFNARNGHLLDAQHVA